MSDRVRIANLNVGDRFRYENSDDVHSLVAIKRHGYVSVFNETTGRTLNVSGQTVVERLPPEPDGAPERTADLAKLLEEWEPADG